MFDSYTTSSEDYFSSDRYIYWPDWMLNIITWHDIWGRFQVILVRPLNWTKPRSRETKISERKRKNLLQAFNLNVFAPQHCKEFLGDFTLILWAIVPIVNQITDIRAFYQAVLPTAKTILENNKRSSDIEGTFARSTCTSSDTSAHTLTGTGFSFSWFWFLDPHNFICTREGLGHIRKGIGWWWNIGR